jgi:hypothetical protein
MLPYMKECKVSGGIGTRSVKGGEFFKVSDLDIINNKVFERL